MHLIASALLRRGLDICLVEQQAPWEPQPEWMLPGGRVEQAESILAALGREVVEETGLTIVDQPRVVFLVELITAEGPYTAITFECGWKGELDPADPDGIVRAAEWFPLESALARLAKVQWYDVVPLQRYLAGEAAPGAAYRLDTRAR